MLVTVKRLTNTYKTRIGMVCLAIVLWFLLVMAVVRNMQDAIKVKTEMFGSAVTQGFGIGAISTPDSLLQQMSGVSLNHPIVLALVGAITVALGVKACQGELLDGTLELTLSGPIKRRRYLLGYVFVSSLAIAIFMLFTGLSIMFFPKLLSAPGHIQGSSILWTSIVGFLVYTTFVSFSLLISVLLGRKGSAMALSVALLTVMYAITFAERAWDNSFIQAIGPLSVFHWFDPGALLSGVQRNPQNIVMPLVQSIVAVATACFIFERRDL